MTKTQFCNEFSHAALASAVIRQCGGWDSFKEMAADVANHGADGGFHGFIYYTETVKFAKAHKADILDYARQMADDLGESLYGMIGGFNCLKISEGEAAEAIHNARSDDHTSVMNALAWFALEEVSRRYADECETA
jgi:hypothetical protein